MTELARVEFTQLAPTVVYPVDQNPALIYLASLSEGSRRTMIGALQSIVAIVQPDASYLTFPWHALRFQHTAAIQVRLLEGHSPATAKKMLAALRGVLKACWLLELMTAEDYHRAINTGRIKVNSLPQAERGRMLSDGEVRALIDVCVSDKTPLGLRDAAIFAVGIGCGLRRAEIAKLLVADFDAEKNTLLVQHGKRDKPRSIPLADGTRDLLIDWLAVRGLSDGAMFLAFNGSNSMTDRGISAQVIYDMLGRRATAARVKAFAPHDMRRTFISNALDVADTATVKGLAGHDDINTTAGYDRRGQRAKQDAVSKLHIPYARGDWGKQ